MVIYIVLKNYVLCKETKQSNVLFVVYCSFVLHRRDEQAAVVEVFVNGDHRVS